MISLKKLIISLVFVLSIFSNPTFASENQSTNNQVKALLFSSPIFKEGEKALQDKGYKIDRSKCIIQDIGNGKFQVYLSYKGSDREYDIAFVVTLPEGKVSHDINKPSNDEHWSFPWIPIFW